jgi:PTS system nitrogen regulatory IIA component
VPYSNMSLDDFARHVGMDVREVCRLADRGTLPGQKVGGQWRFNRARVTEGLRPRR